MDNTRNNIYYFFNYSWKNVKKFMQISLAKRKGVLTYSEKAASHVRHRKSSICVHALEEMGKDTDWLTDHMTSL